MRSPMTDRALGALLTLALVAVPAALHAQDWRDVTSFRQRSGESALDVEVRYGAGELRIRQGTGGELYRVAIRYDADVFDPITQFGNGRLEVGVEGRGRGINVKDTQSGEMTLSLSPDVPLDMDLHFGAVEAELDLGGLRIRRLDMETGASDTEVRFARPNPIDCDRLDLSVGAAAFRMEGLGNANCTTVSVEGGIGDVVLDFGGEWRRNLDADVTMALGSITLIIPEDVGVRVNRETFLASFNAGDFDKRDGAYYSRNWETARYRMVLDVEGAFGDFNIRRGRPVGVATP